MPSGKMHRSWSSWSAVYVLANIWSFEVPSPLSSGLCTGMAPTQFMTHRAGAIFQITSLAMKRGTRSMA